jgi:hypothetical protein
MGGQSFRVVRARSSIGGDILDVFLSRAILGTHRKLRKSEPAFPASLLPPEERGVFPHGAMGTLVRREIRRRKTKGGKPCRSNFK